MPILNATACRTPRNIFLVEIPLPATCLRPTVSLSGDRMVFTIGANTGASLGISIFENGASADTITVALPLGANASRFVRTRVAIAR
jgi:hypothetical protein